MSHHYSAGVATSPPFWVRYYDLLTGVLALGRTKAVHRATLNLAHVRPGERLLDVGCGTGELALAAQDRIGQTGQVVGLDTEAAMIAQAQRKVTGGPSTVTFRQGTIDAIPYPAGHFDVAIASLVVHHLPDPRPGLAEVVRVLKDGGRFLVVDIDPTHRSLISMLHHNMPRKDFVRDELPSMLAAAGFSNVNTGKHPFKKFSYALAIKQ